MNANNACTNFQVAFSGISHVPDTRSNGITGWIPYLGCIACQVFDSYVRSSNYALLAIAEMPNNELTSIHTLSLPPLHL